MAITIDASAVAAWLLPDEASPAADQLYALALQASEVFQAPALLAWEVGNLLNTACRRKRLTPKLATDALNLFLKAGIHLAAAPQGQRMQETLDLARSHDLSFYDASYMEQALRTGAKLATKDASLRRQASKAGVLCLEL
jgi:predicted nucleic acid-binding protein